MSVRILVVEDNLALAENIQELLDENGVKVGICARADEAARYLADETNAEALDLAILDMRLPRGESGLELVPRVRKAAPHAEVILVTGNATLGSAIDAVRHGVFAYLQKPFDPSDLLALAERAIAQVSLRRERKRLAEELARSEALHRSVIETVDSLIVGLDDDHRIRMWNRWAENVTGWTVAEALEKHAGELLFEDAAAFERIVSAGVKASAASAELPIRTKHGERRIVHWRITPLAGAQPMILVAGTDITERLELEARAAGAEALAVMGRLTAGLAHEIRNPLNAAKLQLELMRRAARGLEVGAVRESLESRTAIVQSELDRLTRLLDEFLGLARPDHLALSSIDLAAVITEVIALESPVADAAKITLEAHIGDIPRVHGDAAKLKQALVNLIVNSIEAIGSSDREGARVIRVFADPSADRKMVELRVEDTGPGLAAPAPELLEPFVTTKAGGTGLGLAIVKRILELHGGSLEMDARAGGGAVVRLALRATPSSR